MYCQNIRDRSGLLSLSCQKNKPEPERKVRKNSMKTRTAYIIAAAVLGAWLILPDPLPVVADDILAGLGSAAAVLCILRLKNSE